MPPCSACKTTHKRPTGRNCTRAAAASAAQAQPAAPADATQAGLNMMQEVMKKLDNITARMTECEAKVTGAATGQHRETETTGAVAQGATAVEEPTNQYVERRLRDATLDLNLDDDDNESTSKSKTKKVFSKPQQKRLRKS